MTETSRAVFLSYASEDAEPAQRVCEALRAAGIEVWFDKSELRGGDAWDQTIRQRIRECRLFVPLISAATERRGEGYFRREWKLAVDRTEDMAGDVAFLVPVVIDDTPSTSARVPAKFREMQWTRLPVGETPRSFVARVAGLLGGVEPAAASEAVASVAAASVAAASEAAAREGVGVPPAKAEVPPAKVLPTSRKRSRRALAGLAAVVIAIVCGWIAWRNSGMHAPARSGPAGHPAVAVRDRSIAVLPFADMSENKDQGYFADGMAEEILGVLAKVPRLTVISRTSSFQFKGRDADIKAIGAALGAHYIVEGSVRKSGARMRIDAELVDAGDGTQRWSQSYDRDAGDAFNVQDEIAASIVRALQLAVLGDQEIPARVKPRSPEAYDLYLRGRQALDRFDREGFEQAADLYQRALDLDPQFVPAMNALADAQVFLTQWGYIPPKVGYDRARRTAQLGEKLDPRLGEPHWLLATIHLQYDWDWDAARTELDRADEINPRAPQVILTRGMLSLSLGRLSDSVSQISAALRLDPLSPNARFVLGWARFWSGDLPEAESQFRKALQISPTYESVHYYLGQVRMARGDLTTALGEMKAEPDEESRLAGIASVEFAMGHRKESDAVLAKLTQLSADDWASGIASVHAIRNEADAAFQWLDRAYAQKDEDLYIIKGDPLYKNVAHDPRYAAFLRKMNLPE